MIAIIVNGKQQVDVSSDTHTWCTENLGMTSTKLLA
jgi:hypothetical protein